MPHDLDQTIAPFTTAPADLNALLRNLPEPWTHAEGENTWTVYGVIGHLIHAEQADWIPCAANPAEASTLTLEAYPSSRASEPTGENMSQELYFEDFYVGQKMNSIGSAKVTAEEIKEFGQKYDPQPFHLDEAAGEGSFFKGLAASGWLTAAIVMRLRVQSITVAGGMIGAGVEEMRWTQPVRPGDSIRTEIEVIGVRQSNTRKDYGVVRTRTLAYNQRNEVVLRSTVNFLAPLRHPVQS